MVDNSISFIIFGHKPKLTTDRKKKRKQNLRTETFLESGWAEIFSPKSKWDLSLLGDLSSPVVIGFVQQLVFQGTIIQQF